ncbi:acetyltransferase [Burkholderia ubonensis]|uniref:GNAT family N-acetyltransferase n=1 Tax=Burkholderia ubonensis TaxID=101571 RepID=UPI0007560477|nr:GNAT family N-acetyltransferase [Burkholderia ubonensis]KWO84630.1 acetyltransferase [Burkholderia ubonensis]
MTEPITIRRVSGDEVTTYIDALSDVLIDCVEGGASVSFMLPISRDTAARFWRQVADGVIRGERILLVAERADVAKMLVHRDARRQGVGARLMAAADDAARAAGKAVLVLDTVTGSDAARLYERAGWQRVGDVPNYALMPDGRYCATTFFHKQLA